MRTLVKIVAVLGLSLLMLSIGVTAWDYAQYGGLRGGIVSNIGFLVAVAVLAVLAVAYVVSVRYIWKA